MNRIEVMNPGFTKWHLNEHGQHGWPIRPVLHQFTAPDGGDPHCHPWDFRVVVWRGSYVEEVFLIVPGGFDSYRKTRREGDSFTVPAEHIHRIVALPDGECWTLAEYGPTRRTSQFWRFEPGGRVLSRPWHRAEFAEVAA